jgi:hypothetical protein
MSLGTNHAWNGELALVAERSKVDYECMDWLLSQYVSVENWFIGFINMYRSEVMPRSGLGGKWKRVPEKLKRVGT